MNLIFAIAATTILVVRAISRKSLTVAGILSAVVTASVHALHPWNLPFVLLLVFYGLAITATRIKHEVKERLTLSSSGSPGGEGPRNHIQVFANSIVASFLVLAHCWQLKIISAGGFKQRNDVWFNNDILVVGIIANYSATLADTLASELGILSRSPPRLITTLRPTPPGTNGGVSFFGLLSGASGAAIIGLVSVLLLPYYHGGVAHDSFGTGGSTGVNWSIREKAAFVAFITAVGTLGNLLDSLLGAVFQRSVVDVRTGKIIEGPNGTTVLVEPSSTHLSETPRRQQAIAAEKDTHKAEREHKPSRVVISGEKLSWLNNNEVNFTMALMTTIGAMVWWGGSAEVVRVFGELVGYDSL